LREPVPDEPAVDPGPRKASKAGDAVGLEPPAPTPGGEKRLERALSLAGFIRGRDPVEVLGRLMRGAGTAAEYGDRCGRGSIGLA